MPTKAKSGPVAAITRKIGPLPLWAWFVGALAAYYLFAKLRGGSGQSSSVLTGSGNPGAAATDSSGAPGPGSGGTGADSMNSDLLSALLQGQAQSEQSLIDALNAAYAQASYYAPGYGGYANPAPGSVAQEGTAAQGATVTAAPTAATAADNPATTPSYTPPVSSLTPSGAISLGGKVVATDPTTAGALGDSSYAGPVYAQVSPTGGTEAGGQTLYSTTPLIPRPGTPVAV